MHQWPVRKRYGYEQMITMDHNGGRDYDEWLQRNAPPGNGGWMGGGVMHNDWTAKPWYMDEQYHFTNWTVGQALELLETRDPSCPFFLTVSFIAPHPPLQPPAFYLERYLRTGVPDPIIGDWAQPPANEGKGDDVAPTRVKLTGEALLCARAGYYGLINHVDDQIRRLLNPVTGLPRLAGGNTVVIFTSDHGEMLGDHYLWRKSVPYEGSARIPLMIRAPERFGIRPGAAIDRPVGLEDIMPTALELAGVDIPDTVEGRSLAPLMRGEETPWREHIRIEHAPLHQSLTDGQEKFIWFVETGEEQFFDLAADPGECRNLIEEPRAQERIAQWRQRLIEDLKERPEGFSDGTRLIPGRPYAPVLPR